MEFLKNYYFYWFWTIFHLFFPKIVSGHIRNESNFFNDHIYFYYSIVVFKLLISLKKAKNA